MISSCATFQYSSFAVPSSLGGLVTGSATRTESSGAFKPGISLVGIISSWPTEGVSVAKVTAGFVSAVGLAAGAVVAAHAARMIAARIRQLMAMKTCFIADI